MDRHIVFQLMYWYPYEGALQPIYGTLIKYLISKGYKVTILTSFPHFRTGSDNEWREFRGQLFQIEDWHGATIIRTWVFAPVFQHGSKFSLVFRALNYLTFHFSAFFIGLIKIKDVDLFFLPSNPPVSNGIFGSWLASAKGSPYIYNIQDLYPDVAIQKGVFSKDGLFARVVSWLENRVCLRAAKVCVVADSMVECLAERNIEGDRIVTIPNFVDVSWIRPMDKSTPFRKKHALQGKFVVLYSGNLGVAHDFETILEAALSLLSEKDILFIYTVRGESVSGLKKRVNELALTNVLILPLQPLEDVPELYASADLCLVTLKKEYEKTVIPSKSLSIMAAGRAVVAVMPPANEIAKVIVRANAGVVVAPGDSDDLSAWIKKLYLDQDRTHKFGENGRKYVMDHLSPDVVMRQYESLFQEIPSRTQQ